MISIDHYFHRHYVIGNMSIVIGPSVIISYSALITNGYYDANETRGLSYVIKGMYHEHFVKF